MNRNEVLAVCVYQFATVTDLVVIKFKFRFAFMYQCKNMENDQKNDLVAQTPAWSLRNNNNNKKE